MGGFGDFLIQNLGDFWTYTGIYNATWQHFAMIAIGIFFIYLAVAKEFEPMLLFLSALVCSSVTFPSIWMPVCK